MAHVLSAANLPENSNAIRVISAKKLSQSVKICTEHYTEQILDHSVDVSHAAEFLGFCRQLFHLMVP